MNMWKSFFSVGALTILCRITGYARDWLMSFLLGANAATDALSVAYKMPSLFRRLFAEGAFHVSFLPVFSQSNRDKNFASMVLSLLLLGVGGFVLLVELNFPFIINLFFGSLKKEPETYALVLTWAPVVFPYILCASLVSFFGSILNVYGNFSILALSHAIGNISLLACVGLGLSFTKNIGGLFAWGALLSGIVQVIYILIPCWRYGYGAVMHMPRWTPQVRQFLKNFLPGLLGVGVVQLNAFVSLALAVGLPSGSLSILGYADRLYQLPLSIIGISLGSILLPVLSEKLRKNDREGAQKIEYESLCFTGILTIPVTFFLILMAFPVVSLLFGGGKLTSEDHRKIAWAVVAYGTGLPAYILIKVLNTRFFAKNRTQIPLIGSCLAVAFDIACALALIGTLGHVAIAVGVSLSSWINVLFLAYLIRKEDQTWYRGSALLHFWLRLCTACLPAIFIWSSHFYFFPHIIKGGFLYKAGMVSLLGIAGVASFLFMVMITGTLSKNHWQALLEGKEIDF